MTTTLVATPDPPNDPYGRQAAYEAAVAEREAYYRAHGDAEPPPLPNPLSPYLVDWAEFWAADHDETEWLLEPLFADGRSHALYAGAKTGKSYLVLAACAAMASGRPFMLRPGGNPVRVLYLDFEMTPADVRERLELFGYGPSDDLSNLYYALLPSLPPLDTEEGGQALLAAAQALKAQFVVVDTMSRAISGDEDKSDSFRAFYRCTGIHLKQQGIGWVRLDHAGKDKEKGQRGSSGKNDDVDIVVRLERTDGGQKLTATHRRMSWYPEVTEIAVGEVDGVVTFSTPDGHLWPEGTKACVASLDELGVPIGAGRPAARKALKEAGVTASNKVLTAALRWRKQEAFEALDDLEELVGNRTSSSDKLSADSSESWLAKVQDRWNGQGSDPSNSRADSAADSRGQSDRPPEDTVPPLRGGQVSGVGPDDPDWCPF